VCVPSRYNNCIAKRLIIANSAPAVPSAVPSCRRILVPPLAGVAERESDEFAV